MSSLLQVIEKAKQIRLVIFDVDGVLTDGSLFVGDQGEEYKAFYARDGLGIRLLQDAGVGVGIITGRTSGVVKHRMDSLGIPESHVFQGRVAKLPAFEQLSQDLGLEPHQIAYVGDDIIDVPVMRATGLSVATQDAHPLVKQYAHWVTPHNGGQGAARDVCELVMQAQSTWQTQLARFSVDA